MEEDDVVFCAYLLVDVRKVDGVRRTPVEHVTYCSDF
jgi:hypothetical protein